MKIVGHDVVSIGHLSTLLSRNLLFIYAIMVLRKFENLLYPFYRLIDTFFFLVCNFSAEREILENNFCSLVIFMEFI